MKKYVIMLSLLFLCSCSCAPQMYIISPDGVQIPTPHYTFNPIGTKCIVTFYYQGVKEKKDLDGTIVRSYHYFSIRSKETEIYCEDYRELDLVVQVRNPERLTYSLFQSSTERVGQSFNSTTIKSGGQVGESDFPFRQYVFKIPYGKNVVSGKYSILLYLNGNPEGTIGPFRYKLVH